MFFGVIKCESIVETNALLLFSEGISRNRVETGENTHCRRQHLCVTGSSFGYLYTRPNYKAPRGEERQLSIETDFDAEKPLES